MQKILIVVALMILVLSLLTACEMEEEKIEKFDENKSISVVTREIGSGTRDEFVEFTGLNNEKNTKDMGDLIIEGAAVSKKTDFMIGSIKEDKYSIGYVSTGAMKDSTKVLKVDGKKPTKENIKSGDYEISRPFNLVVKGQATGVKKDFIDFILSKEGQKVVDEQWIGINDDKKSYKTEKPKGELIIEGSSSVSPLMELLIEVYKGMNPNAVIKLKESDSKKGIDATINGKCDIGIVSRELTDEEKEELSSRKIAMDGIAVIVNKDNPMDNISKSEIKNIFTGKTKTWKSLIK